jgi:hypothetical protein
MELPPAEATGDREYIPMVKINPGCIVLYKEYLNGTPRHSDFTGVRIPQNFSAASRSKLMRAVSNLMWLSGAKIKTKKQNRYIYNPNKIVFVTLTLPSQQIHTDKEIKDNCLHQFLIELQKRFKVNTYIWKAEKQTNGRLHFHLVCDKFIPHQWLRSTWNRCINKLSYVDRYQAAMQQMSFNQYCKVYKIAENRRTRCSPEAITQAYATGKAANWKNPNSTDVHKIKNCRSAEAYISKYIAKGDFEIVPEAEKYSHQDRNRVELAGTGKGRIWYCSQNLSEIQPARKMQEGAIMRGLAKLYQRAKDRFDYSNEWVTVIKIRIEEQIQLKIYEFYDEYILTLKPQLCVK